MSKNIVLLLMYLMSEISINHYFSNNIHISINLSMKNNVISYGNFEDTFLKLKYAFPFLYPCVMIIFLGFQKNVLIQILLT
jgi:hypothetical protein